MIYPLLILNILLLVCGQTLWKIGLKNKTLAFTFDSIINLIFNPYI
ncbi:small multidrug resistance transmembrane protein [Clostridium perfringens]|nr:small multidrug resistance transmembrane protein [Clostridium perfringens]